MRSEVWQIFFKYRHHFLAFLVIFVPSLLYFNRRILTKGRESNLRTTIFDNIAINMLRYFEPHFFKHFIKRCIYFFLFFGGQSVNWRALPRTSFISTDSRALSW